MFLLACLFSLNISRETIHGLYTSMCMWFAIILALHIFENLLILVE
ncbi:hypothetical protein BZL35_00726 [Candidatus Pandoraea novymonadis]|uniref:Cytochrome b561 bacterial/Ni-hydrogenase domain-containing protein n=1 Tax=Candidatus Pandoraea novymonadis TaxID=1808959 RepID=A0ABX5FFH5_9BURK|nr:hypothetical protein BZL35_00726 [Candidatus Pandoraea novymonadis]